MAKKPAKPAGNPARPPAAQKNDSVSTYGRAGVGPVVESAPAPDHPINIRTVYLKVWGDRACFARPEFPSELLSYPVMTPSAARGVLEGILYDHRFNWQVRQIRVLKPLRWFTETRNEVSIPGTRENLDRPILTDSKRFQRHARGLTDVAYVIVAEPVPVPYATDALFAFAEEFEIRARTGACLRRPYFGQRQWAAFFGLSDGTETPAAVDLDVGPMTFDFYYDAERQTHLNCNTVHTIPVRFRAKVVKGVLDVPSGLYRYAGGSRGVEGSRPPERPPVSDI